MSFFLEEEVGNLLRSRELNNFDLQFFTGILNAFVANKIGDAVAILHINKFGEYSIEPEHRVFSMSEGRYRLFISKKD